MDSLKTKSNPTSSYRAVNTPSRL